MKWESYRLQVNSFRSAAVRQRHLAWSAADSQISSMEHGERRVRSEQTEHSGPTKIYVRFTNATDRDVNLVWVNFSGSYVHYRKLETNQFLDVMTYTKHPWVAVDYQTKARLHIDNEYVFSLDNPSDYISTKFPHIKKTITQNYKIGVLITTPLYGLRYKCLLSVTNLLGNDEEKIDKLGLPRELMYDLRKLIAHKKQFMCNHMHNN